MSRRNSLRLSILSLCFLFSFNNIVYGQTGSIKSSMYAVPVDETTNVGEARIYWETQNVNQAKVYIQILENGHAPQLMSVTGAIGENIVPWIQKDKHYQFTLFGVVNGSEVPLDTAVVVGIAPIQPSIGLSVFSLAKSFLGAQLQNWGESDGLIEMNKDWAKKAIQDAKERGFTYVRVPVSSWFFRTRELELYLNDPNAFWQRMDEFMDYMSANNMQIIPILFHEYRSLAYHFDESNRDVMLDPNSQGYQTLRNYISDYVNRYKDHPAIYLYEISGELNSRADINILPGQEPTINKYDKAENFTSYEMMEFFEEICALIRSIDDSKLISSGFAMPRKNSYYTRFNPYGSPGWSASNQPQNQDNLAEFTEYMRIIHEPFDVVCVHIYNQANFLNRFGLSNEPNSADMVNILKQISDDQHKLLYLGEFGDELIKITEDPSALFSINVLIKIFQLDIPLSTPFVWQLYNNSPYKQMAYNVEPGLTDNYINAMRYINAGLGNSVTLPTNDIVPPRVIITYPFDETDIATDTQLIYAVASDLNGVDRVEFRINNSLKFTDYVPPYSYNYPIEGCSEIKITATAFDINGLSASYEVIPNNTCDGNLLVFDFTTNTEIETLLFDPISGLQDPNPKSFWGSTSDRTRVTVQNLTINGQEQLFANKYNAGFHVQNLPTMAVNRLYLYRLYTVNQYNSNTTQIDSVYLSTAIDNANRMAIINEFEEKTSSELIEIYPNPTSDILWLRNYSKSESIQVLIFNTAGEIVIRNNYEIGNQSDISIDISSLSKGHYFIRLNNQIQSFIKQN